MVVLEITYTYICAMGSKVNLHIKDIHTIYQKRKFRGHHMDRQVFHLHGKLHTILVDDLAFLHRAGDDKVSLLTLF
jgi:hypothetical protein